MREIIVCLFAAIFLGALAPASIAQPQKERTLDEIKAEAIKRAENGMYPLIGLDPADVREAFSHLTSTDNDAWAAAFSAVADRYMTEAKSQLASDPAKADANFIRAWRLYSFARWPVPASPGKKRAYAMALEAFLDHAKMMDPPLEVVHIPFEGSEIVGYLRLPKNRKSPVPVVIAISGLDSRKEDLTENFGVVLNSGIGFIGVDSPGTGQAPIKASVNAERMFSKVIDYLETRPEVDKTRIGVDGQSFGAYWATKLSIEEHARLKAVVAQSPPVDASFQKDFVLQKTLGNREYLFGLGPALAFDFRRRESGGGSRRNSAEVVAGESAFAGQADHIHADHRGRAGYASACFRRVSAIEQWRCSERSVDQSARRPLGTPGENLARPGNFQKSARPLASPQPGSSAHGRGTLTGSACIL